MAKLTFKPSAELVGHYKVVGTTQPLINFGGVVDLRTITLAEAHYFVANGFAYLEKVKKKR